MTQTFIDTSTFQIIITIIVSLCIIGIFATFYNIIYYRRIKCSGDSITKQYAQSAIKMSMIVLIVFIIAIIMIVTILTMNLNELKIEQQMIKPEVATAESLAEIFQD